VSEFTRCNACGTDITHAKMRLDDEAAVCIPCWNNWPAILKDFTARLVRRIAILETSVATEQAITGVAYRFPNQSGDQKLREFAAQIQGLESSLRHKDAYRVELEEEIHPVVCRAGVVLRRNLLMPGSEAPPLLRESLLMLRACVVTAEGLDAEEMAHTLRWCVENLEAGW